jgi:DNA polymerase-3 subunit gamma/tau
VPRGGEPTPVVSANPEPVGDGELTTSDVRRVWPELLAVVKRHKRTTEALLKNAQVHQLSNGVLTLATASPALARRLGDDLNKDVIREALNELLGVRWRVDAVVEGAAAAPGPAVAPEQAREAARAAEAAEARELMAERAADESAGGDRDPEPAVDPEQAALSLLRAQLGARPVES